MIILSRDEPFGGGFPDSLPLGWLAKNGGYLLWVQGWV
jgi:hypothetical protein